MQPFVELQRRRLKFAELGAQLEQFAPRRLNRSSDMWSGSRPRRLISLPAIPRVSFALSQDPVWHRGPSSRRLFQLLLTRSPDEVLSAAPTGILPDKKLPTIVVANGDAAQAHALVSSRGRTRTPVWSKAYNALVGLYFAEKTPEVNGAFLSALGDNTIAERLAKPVDRAQQLAGNIWFYYGSRYGEYAGMTNKAIRRTFFPRYWNRVLQARPVT